MFSLWVRRYLKNVSFPSSTVSHAACLCAFITSGFFCPRKEDHLRLQHLHQVSVCSSKMVVFFKINPFTLSCPFYLSLSMWHWAWFWYTEKKTPQWDHCIIPNPLGQFVLSQWHWSPIFAWYVELCQPSQGQLITLNQVWIMCKALSCKENLRVRTNCVSPEKTSPVFSKCLLIDISVVWSSRT